MRQTTLTEGPTPESEMNTERTVGLFVTGRENNSLKELNCEYSVCSSSVHVSVELSYSKYLPFLL
jgi:hypothetical protein